MGTSGWQYKDWRGGLYPARLPQRLWLEHFAGAFASVEINNAFYRLPTRENFAAWAARTPDDFCFAVKMSRYLTHVKRLREPAEPVARFLSHAEPLGAKLGPVLIQLPPTLKIDLAALDETLSGFPAHIKVAVEPRHDSWWTPEVENLLRRHHAALAWADRLGRPVTPLWVTADWVYLRLHEGKAKPWPHYGRTALSTWVDRLPDLPAYVYFNNDPGGAAVTDATTMARLARRRGREVTRTP